MSSPPSTCSSCWTPASSTAEVLVRHARSESELGDSLHRFMSAVLGNRLQDLKSEYTQGIPGMDQLVWAVYERRNSPQDRTEAIEKLLSTLSLISDLDDEMKHFTTPNIPTRSGGSRARASGNRIFGFMIWCLQSWTQGVLRRAAGRWLFWRRCRFGGFCGILLKNSAMMNWSCTL